MRRQPEAIIMHKNLGKDKSIVFVQMKGYQKHQLSINQKFKNKKNPNVGPLNCIKWVSVYDKLLLTKIEKD